MNHWLGPIYESQWLASLGVTFLHSLWQVFIVGATTVLLVSITPKARAAIRYRIAMGGLLFCFLASVGTYVYVLDGSPVNESEAMEVSKYSQPVGEVKTVASPISSPTMESGLVSSDRPLEPIITSQSSEVVEMTSSDTTNGSSGWIPLLGAVWLIGAVGFGLRQGVGVALFLRLRFSGLSPVDKRIERVFRRHVDGLELKRRVVLFQSAIAKVPMVLGFFRSMILLPPSALTSLSAKELDAVLLHELAHLKRLDDVHAMFQVLIETLFFFHPVVWWLSSLASQERENSCDDMAIAQLGTPTHLASALLLLARNKEPAPVLAATNGSLVHRLRRVMEVHGGMRNNGRFSYRWGAPLLSIAMPIVLALASAGVAMMGTSDSTATELDRQTSPQISNVQPTPASQGMIDDESQNGRTELLKRLRKSSDDQLQEKLSDLLRSKSFVYQFEYEPILTEIVFRGGEDWARFLTQELNELNQRVFVSESGNPQLDTRGDQYNLELVTALRRIEGKPDPLSVEVELPDSHSLTPFNLPKIVVRIKNRDTQDLGVQIGGNYRSGRQTRWLAELTGAKANGRVIKRFGMGGGISTMRFLKPGDSWETELILRHIVEVDVPGEYQLEVKYSNQQTILNEDSTTGLIVFSSEPKKLVVLPAAIENDSKIDERVAELVKAFDDAVLPHVIDGIYGDWSAEFLPERSPQSEICKIGLNAVPELIRQLDQKDPTSRAKILGLLYSITGQKDPRYPGVIGEYQYVAAGWEMRNSVQVSQNSGQVDSGPIELAAQEQFINAWNDWAAKNGSGETGQDKDEIKIGFGQPVLIDVGGNKVRGIASPKGQFVFAQLRGRSKEIFVCDLDGSNLQQLTNNRAIDYSPCWSADGNQILFCSTRSGSYQIYEMDSNGGNVRRLTDHKNGARNPVMSKEGWLAYQRMGERNGKSHPSDLILRHGDEELVVMEDVDLTDYRWSPEGTSICVGATNKIHFFSMKDRKLTSFDLSEFDERMFAHGPYEIIWGPNSEKIACRIRFLGGRGISINGEANLIYGDEEVFTISPEGKFQEYGADLLKETEDWIRLRFRNP